jgi:hypothetical protein
MGCGSDLLAGRLPPPTSSTTTNCFPPSLLLLSPLDRATPCQIPLFLPSPISSGANLQVGQTGALSVGPDREQHVAAAFTPDAFYRAPPRSPACSACWTFRPRGSDVMATTTRSHEANLGSAAPCVCLLVVILHRSKPVSVGYPLALLKASGGSEVPCEQSSPAASRFCAWVR